MNNTPFKLSEQQTAVDTWVQHGTGSLELVARAGCGKTSTLMVVIDTIVRNKMGDVAVMAYNKSIATEIKGRLESAGYDWKAAQAGTVHSFGYGAWRKVAPAVKLNAKKVFEIIDAQKNTDNAEIFTECAGPIAKMVAYGKQRAVGHLSAIEDITVWYDIWDHFDVENDVTENWTADEIIRAVQYVYRISLKQCREVIDFDDMILAPLYFKARFWPKKWILVDESQDTNPARRALALAMLAPRVGRMIFVGDDRQAIYGFTGADSDSMSQLRNATKAITLPLTVTYRCPKLIVAEAQKLVPDIVAHESAPEGVVRSIAYQEMMEKEVLTKDDVILCRNTAPLVQTAYSLLARGVACRVEGREIGEGLAKLAQRWKVTTLLALLNKLEDYEARMTAKFMSKGQEEKVGALVDQIDCLRVLITRCQSMNQHSLTDLLSAIDTMFGSTPDGEKAKVLTLSTIHKSKGREWKRVFLLGRQAFMPSPYARKEWQQVQETNLEYVAVTRAQAELIDVSAPAKPAK
jgi:DNA helicase II / ATP-dependent DNA helicase PcrA